MSGIDNTQAIIRKFEPVLKDLSEHELITLNKMIVERLRFMHKAASLLHLTKFSVGDRVSWDGRDGLVRAGIIIRLNNQTASVKVGESEYWKVSPQLLRKG
jgi:hypothetical protein